jgi:hypothetical protein
MKKSQKHGGLAQQYYTVSLQWLLKGAATLSTSKKECNKYDLTAAQYF